MRRTVVLFSLLALMGCRCLPVEASTNDNVYTLLPLTLMGLSSYGYTLDSRELIDITPVAISEESPWYARWDYAIARVGHKGIGIRPHWGSFTYSRYMELLHVIRNLSSYTDEEIDRIWCGYYDHLRLAMKLSGIDVPDIDDELN